MAVDGPVRRLCAALVVVALALLIPACTPRRSAHSPAESTTVPPPVSAGGGGGVQPTDGAGLAEPGDGADPADEGAQVTVPAGASTPADIVAALEAQRAGRSPALYWRHLLLHAAASDAYLYINDATTSDLDTELRSRTAAAAITALNRAELWSSGQPRPALADFASVAEELTSRARAVASVEVLAANAARSTQGAGFIDVVIVYRPTYADGSSDRTNRLVVVTDKALSIVNAYYF